MSARVWKVAACTFAVTTAVAVARPMRQPPAARATAAAAAAPRRAPVRPSDEDALLRELEAADGSVEIAALLERLGKVGSERALPLLARLADDRRIAVAEAALAALGRVGGDDATELLLSFAERGRPRAR